MSGGGQGQGGKRAGAVKSISLTLPHLIDLSHNPLALPSQKKAKKGSPSAGLPDTITCLIVKIPHCIRGFSEVDISPGDGIIIAQEFEDVCMTIKEYIKNRVSDDMIFTPCYPKKYDK